MTTPTDLDRAMREKAQKVLSDWLGTKAPRTDVSLRDAVVAFGRDCAHQAREDTSLAIADRLFEADKFLTWGETLDFCDKALAQATPTREETKP